MASAVMDKVVRTRKAPPQALKRLHMFSDLAARLKSGPSQNLREFECFRHHFSHATQPQIPARAAQGPMPQGF